MSEIEVNDNVVTGYVGADRVVQFRVSNGEILTDTSACLPSKNPERYVHLYMDCLNLAKTLLRESQHPGPPYGYITVKDQVVPVVAKLSDDNAI